MPALAPEPNADVEVKEIVERVEEEQSEEPEATQNEKSAEDDVKVTETKPLSVGFHLMFYIRV